MTTDAPAYRELNTKGDAGVLFICEHAGNAIPNPWQDLGLDQTTRNTHFAYDLGAAELTSALATRLNAPAVLATYSRLFLDYNRPYWHPQYMREALDGPPVPGNTAITEDQRTAREAIAFHPLRRAINGRIRNLRKNHALPALVSVHTCTPIWNGEKRPWEVSVLWRYDDRLVNPMLGHLRDDSSFHIGDNEPYDCREIPAFCLEYHAEPFRLPHFYLEVRNDICTDPASLARCVETVATALKKTLATAATAARQ